MTLPNDDALDKSGAVFRPNFVTNGSRNHEHDFLVPILTVRCCRKADDVTGADFIKKHFVTGSGNMVAFVYDDLPISPDQA